MIEARQLTKTFGNHVAVDDVSFEVQDGEVFGLLGENGAGKTTTLRMLATLLTPTSGTALIGGHDLRDDSRQVRLQLGIIFEGGVYDRLTVRENMRYFGRLYGRKGAALEQRITHIFSWLSMDTYADKRAGNLSKGMKQKLVIGRALIHDPPVLLMDEPTSGLDVTAARLVHEFILLAKSEGKTVLLSSHNMAEVEKLCDRIAVIHRGRLVAIGTLDEFKSRAADGNLEQIFSDLVGDQP